MHIQTHTHTHTHTRARARTHPHTHKHIDKHTHTHCLGPANRYNVISSSMMLYVRRNRMAFKRAGGVGGEGGRDE